MLYAEGRSRFADFIGKTRGVEFLFLVVGTWIAGLDIAVVADRGALWLGAWALAAVLMGLGVRCREPALPAQL